jgi:hypothetical protein
VSRSFRHRQYADLGVPTVQGLQKVSDSGGEKLKTPAKLLPCPLFYLEKMFLNISIDY